MPPYMKRTLGILLLGGLCVALVGCQPKTPAPPAPAPPEVVSPRSGSINWRNYQFTFPDAGPPVWTARVAQGSGHPEDGTLVLHGVTCTLYKAGHAALHVQADDGRAVLKGKTAQMTLSGHVHAVEPLHGMHMTAQTFHWNSQDDHIIANAVQMDGLGYTHRADQGDFTTDLTRAAFSGHVQTATADFAEGTKE